MRAFDNFAALEPTRLAANAFALAALGDDTLGVFEGEATHNSVEMSPGSVPIACALGVHDLAAEAFAAAAFGERILSLMRIDGTTTLFDPSC